ncbi:MAG: hypothetical protein ABJF07_18725 [Nisaea sp.]|uniref:hypothetical protein n=1 Tax=Nisaea sp. TaxID=2024842 RepID=UPI0032648083
MKRQYESGYCTVRAGAPRRVRRGDWLHSRRLDSAGGAAWKKANTRLYSLLLFSTTGSAHRTLKAHQNNALGYVGDGAAAWKALKDRLAGNTKEARRALREQLHSQKLKSGDRPH